VSNCQLTIDDQEGEVPDPSRLEQLASSICRAEDPGCRYEISLLFCDDETMRRYNRTYRGSDAATDVLSFVTAELGNGEGRARICDIIIDTKQVDRQKGHKSFERELSEVFIHALLHLAGYDHIRPEARKHMEEKETTYQSMIEGTHTSG
jgi:probable rRNA maturation factor